MCHRTSFDLFHCLTSVFDCHVLFSGWRSFIQIDVISFWTSSRKVSGLLPLFSLGWLSVVLSATLWFSGCFRKLCFSSLFQDVPFAHDHFGSDFQRLPICYLVAGVDELVSLITDCTPAGSCAFPRLVL